MRGLDQRADIGMGVRPTKGMDHCPSFIGGQILPPNRELVKELS
jgi:hypothetical protein